jgi:hypothetical protein
MRAAIAADVPPDEPPGIRVTSYGFLTGPAKGARLVLVMPNASSCRLVLPMTTAPASSSFCSDGALRAGRACCSAGVVGISDVLMLSLMTTGRPASRPVRAPASTCRAAASAPSRFKTMNALRWRSFSARSSAACTTLTAVSFLSRIAATISAAVTSVELAIEPCAPSIRAQG